MKQIPNIITSSRIVVALYLSCLTPFSWPFFLCYTYCGVSDMVDGTIARMMQAQSRMGAVLDSISDCVFFIVVLAKVFPVIRPAIPTWSLAVIAIIAAVKIAAYIVGSIRFHRLAMLHTVLNKLSGAALFASVYILNKWSLDSIMMILCILTGITAIEEFLCQLILKEYNPDIPTILRVREGKERK
ncbi:MAG: CDP-alcohol phosphatidyltransferase family protein [bacterium]|nr:CDP-alcohol phosphatidyltransferase family protein [bacterium]